jgi:hypothetical protein
VLIYRLTTSSSGIAHAGLPKAHFGVICSCAAIILRLVSTRRVKIDYFNATGPSLFPTDPWLTSGSFPWGSGERAAKSERVGADQWMHRISTL